MATLTIGNHEVDIDDGFLRLSPEQQQKGVEEIARQIIPSGEDVDTAARSGVANGIAHWIGGPADMANLLARGADTIQSKLSGRPVDDVRAENDANALVPTTTMDRFGSDAIKGAMKEHLPAEGAAKHLGYQPFTRSGKFMKALTTAIPALPTGAVATAASTLAGEGARQAAEGTSLEAPAAVAAGILAPIVAGRVITPFNSQPHLAGPARIMRDEGVPLSAGQATGNDRLRWAETTLKDMPFAGGGGQRMINETGQGFNRAVARRMGEDLGEEGMLTTDVMARASDRISGQFRALSGRNALVADQQLVQDLAAIRARHDPGLSPDQIRSIERILNDKLNMFQQTPTGAVMPGQAYQGARSDLSTLAHNAPNAREGQVLREARNALDNAMERSIARTNPGDLGAWQEARQQYSAWKLIQRGTNSTAEKAAQGFVSPAQIGAGAAQRSPTNYTTGRDEWSDLSHAANATMKPLPNSGTAQRAMMIGALGGGAVAGSYAGDAAMGDDHSLGTIAGLAAGIGVPALAGRYVASPIGRSHLSNRVVRERPTVRGGAARAFQQRDDD